METGAIALLEFETGLRAEMHTGTMQVKGRAYQDYEIFGTRGRIHRAGDRSEPVLRIQTDDRAGWQSLAVEPDQEFTRPGLYDAILASLYQFARTIHSDEPHPLNARSALKDLEVLMAVHESARLRDRIELPLDQPRYPLEILIEEGQL